MDSHEGFKSSFSTRPDPTRPPRFTTAQLVRASSVPDIILPHSDITRAYPLTGEMPPMEWAPSPRPASPMPSVKSSEGEPQQLRRLAAPREQENNPIANRAAPQESVMVTVTPQTPLSSLESPNGTSQTDLRDTEKSRPRLIDDMRERLNMVFAKRMCDDSQKRHSNSQHQHQQQLDLTNRRKDSFQSDQSETYSESTSVNGSATPNASAIQRKRVSPLAPQKPARPLSQQERATADTTPAASASETYGQTGLFRPEEQQVMGQTSQSERLDDSESGIYFDTSSSHDSREKRIETDGEDGEDENEEDEELWRPYDLFTLSDREVDDDRIFRQILKFTRCFLYVIFVLVMLGGTVANRIALFLLASDINQSKEARSQSVVHLILCMCAPMFYSWLQAFMKIMFGGKEWPSFRTFFMILVIELLSTAATCFLVFRIIPSTDLFRGITLTFAIFQIPSLFELMMQEKDSTSRLKKSLKMLVIVLATLAQLGAPMYFTLMDFSVERHDKKLSGNVYPGETPVKGTLLQDFDWEIPLALMLVSLAWWENFVSKDLPFFPGFRLPFRRWRQVLQETRDTNNFFVAPFKMGLVVLLGRYLADADFDLFTWHNDSDTSSWDSFKNYTLLTIILGSAILCTYLGGLACKLHMQRIAFALPLLLSPPASLAVVYLQCRYEFLSGNWHTGAWYCPNLELEDLYQPIAVAAALWISYCIITSYVWFPKVERMAKTEKLFLTPHFTSTFPDFNLTLRRRRDDKELRKTAFGTYAYVGKQTILNDGGKTSAHSGRTTGMGGADGNQTTPTIFVCATMWHETKQEMTQLLKSLFRMDYDHCASRLAQAKFNIRDPDYFDMEIHIVFDDAFELGEASKKYEPNGFVRTFIGCMEDAARSVVKGYIVIPSPIKVATPYGGRLVWTMPGQTQLVVHLKNKHMIRHRKRWSQVMYMYYLLGFRLLGSGTGNDVTGDDTDSQHPSPTVRNRKKMEMKRKNMPVKQLLMRRSRQEYEQILDISDNTFILTLDGDIDFKPDSVKLLLDRMKKDKKVGAVCGRIHPIGSGPMVWYQQFEYAVSHWLQKAAEHVFGCVLCCPGCFSLFRGSALMDDNVLKMYTTKPTEARHYIQFEQGEDRWLCTLLLQQGYRIDYSAGADAWTFVPETFNEFFNQRRRWSPSTLANLMDLLGSWRSTVHLNDNISRLYVLYQFTSMAASILAPSTVLLMITDSYHTVFHINMLSSYVVSVLPVVLYMFVCLTQKTSRQIKIGALLSALYTVVMMIATVGTVINMVSEQFSSPNTIFISVLVTVFVISAALHPQEIHCLVFGVVYFLVIPTTFVLLTVFYLCNLNNVSWGTREVVQKLTPEEQAELEQEKEKKSWNVFSVLGLKKIVVEAKEIAATVLDLRKDIEGKQHTIAGVDVQNKTEQVSNPPPKKEKTPNLGVKEDLENPHWLQHPELGNGPVEVLSESETRFWEFLIKKYLHPLDENKEEKEKIAKDLLDARNNVVFVYVLLNFLWTVIALQLQAAEDELKDFYIARRHEPLSVLFLAIFTIVLMVQFIGMFIHRWGTFLHLMSSTNIDWFFGTHSDDDFARFVVQELQKHQNLEPQPDYGDDDDDDEDFYAASLPSELTDLDDNNGDALCSQTQSVRGSQRGYNDNRSPIIWPREWTQRPVNPGHFPRLENILEQNLDRLKQHINRTGQGGGGGNGGIGGQGGVAGRGSRRGSFLGSLRGAWHGEGGHWDRNGGGGGAWRGTQRSSSGRRRKISGWSAREDSMRQRFLQHNVFVGQGRQQPSLRDSGGEAFQGIKVV